MMAKWWKALDVGDHAGALLTDLSKAFDCIDRGLVLVVLNPYGLDSRSKYFLFSCLDKRKQRRNVNSSYSDFDELC